MINYSKGRFILKHIDGQLIGRLDGDEYVRSDSKLLYRIEEDEIYSMDGALIGFIDYGTVRTADGLPIFRISKE